jgi:hypothetical protein
MAIIIEDEETTTKQDSLTDSLQSIQTDMQTLANVQPATNMQIEHLFACGVYRVPEPRFLEVVSAVHKEYISKIKKENPQILKTVYPTVMTENLLQDPRLAEFVEFVAKTSWEVLNNQGYNMAVYDMFYFDMFGQEHHKYSGHDTHTHPGAQITGFYFLECPENSCRPVFQDPRPAKYYAHLQEANPMIATLSSNEINYQPNAGDFFFTNSWLPHSFTRNANVKPFKFIHFSLGVSYKPQ